MPRKFPLFGLLLSAPILSIPAVKTEPPKQTANPLDAKYQLGLAAWRKPGRIDNAACSNCHGPDGFELAIYDFDNTTILRRAHPHLDAADAKNIVGLIEAVREKYHITKKLSPMSDRPLQPTGHVLPGNTPLERDDAFAVELQGKLPLLSKGRIRTIAEAKTAADQLVALDPWNLTIGVPFNRFSEDVFHGKEHASLAHWLPDVARQIPPENVATWNALQDDYLANPNDENLWKLYNRFDELTRPANKTGLAEIAGFKYKSLLLMQHEARRQDLGEKIVRPPIAFASFPDPIVPNPMWEVGEIARRFQDLSGAGIGMDPQELAKKSGGPSFRQQMLDMQTSWFWLGWLFDQGLNRTSRNLMTARGDWLAFSLGNSGPYPVHNIYWLTRKQLIANRIPNAWGGQPDRRRPEWTYLSVRIGDRYISDMPKTNPAKQRYIAFTANCFRMTMLLMLDEWQRTKVVWYRNEAYLHIKALTEFIETFQPDSKPEIAALRKELDRALIACIDKR